MVKKLTEKQRRSRANLKPFKKGQSGNPKGRTPKDLCITSLIKEELEEIASTADGKKMTWAQLFAKALVRKACKGHNVAIKEVIERVDGKVPTPVEHKNDPDNPMIGMVVYIPEEDKD